MERRGKGRGGNGEGGERERESERSTQHSNFVTLNLGQDY